jgi:hypothetical protein
MAVRLSALLTGGTLLSRDIIFFFFFAFGIYFCSKLSETHGLEQPEKKKKLHGQSERANYTDRATAACRRSDCQLVRIEGATWSV